MSTEPAQSICLVDGSGYIFRAFYALPIMTRDDKTPVNAVYGFLHMLMNLIENNACSHVVVVFDAKRKNFRNDIFPEYKATRKETPPELVPQFPLIREATEVLNLRWVEMEGYEADDLIASYAREAVSQGFHVQVVSADKDLMQLMGEHVSIYDPMKKRVMNVEDVMNKFGVTPDKVTDVQSLMGDSTDNIPGASGIGPKTAAALINEFGSLENLLQNLDLVKNEKRREKLIQDKEKIIISQKLVTLDKNAPISKDLSVFELKPPKFQDIEPFLLKNNFKSLLARSSNWVGNQTQQFYEKTEIKKDYTLIQTVEDLQKWVDSLKKSTLFAIDTETTSLDVQTAKLVGFSLSDKPGHACYVPLRHGMIEDTQTDLFSDPIVQTREKQIDPQVALQMILPLLKDKEITKIGHNIKYDMHILARELGSSFEMNSVVDTMILSYILDGTLHGHSMDELAQMHLGYSTIKYDDVCGTGKDKISFDALDIYKACEYAAEDADVTYRLYEYLSPKLAGQQKYIFEKIESPLVSILFEMESAGIKIDKKHLINLNTFFAKELSCLTEKIYETAGEEFNINSPAQLGEILFEKMGLSGGKKGAKGSYSTDVKVLETLASNGCTLAQLVLDYRSYAKLKSTYTDSLLTQADSSSRVHTSFMQTVTNTGRLSSTHPNLQNIPIKNEAGKEIRASFIAKEGYKIVSADYSQIELRLLADVADIKSLKQSFIHNEDIHARTASQIFNVPLEDVSQDLRRQAKAINFGIVYGISAFGLANNLGISRTDAAQYIEAYFKEYPEIKTYMDNTISFVNQNEYVLTPMGRKCYIKGVSDPRTKALAQRAAINAPIQGGAADIIKLAMISVHQELKKHNFDATILLQVHDELVLEVKDQDVESVSKLLKETMENVVTLSIPLVAEVGVGSNWRDAH